jgi:hypothetical protein
MPGKSVRAAVLAALVVAAPAARAQAQSSSAVDFIGAPEAMKGIATMKVLVEEIPELGQVLQASTLKSAAELKLRQAGIAVLAEDDQSASLSPELYLNCSVIALSDGSFVYSMDIEFHRIVQVTIPTDSNTHFMNAIVWNQGTFGIVPRQQAAQMIGQTVDKEVSDFLKIYLSANSQ